MRYHSPDGRTLTHAVVAELRAAVLNPRLEYWHTGTRVAAIVRPYERLFAAYADSVGFFLDYGSEEIGLFSAVASPDDICMGDGPVTIYPGGLAITLPRRQFISPDMAWRAIREFALGPGLPVSVRWDVDAPVRLGWHNAIRNQIDPGLTAA